MIGKIRKLWRTRGRRRVLLNAIGNTPSQVLLPRRDGYLAYWVFDVLDDESHAVHTLLVHLTRSEARKVLARDVYREGFLEPVRRTLHDSRGVVLVERRGLPSGLAAIQIRIPTAASEAEFLEYIDRAAEEAPRVYELSTLAQPPEVAEAVREVQAAEHNIESHNLAMA